MKNNFINLLTFVFMLAGCGGKMAGESFVIDRELAAIAQSPVVFPPAGGLTLSSTDLRIGSLLTITSTSTDLSNATSATVNGTSAIILNKSANQMQVFVMPGSTTGYVGITTSAGIDYSASQVTITQATAGASYTQQGNKFSGSGTSGTQTAFGAMIDISADGNFAAIGGPIDNNMEGGVWLYARNGASWTEMGPKLLGSDTLPGPFGPGGAHGYGVSLSANGDTLMFGGPYDDNIKGAVWFFTRNGTSWTQQGPKIIPTDVSGTMAAFGSSGDLSADGNTAIIGGVYDDNLNGAAWIYVRSGSSWTQQAKLIASDFIGPMAQQASKVALSADGNTAIVSAVGDNGNAGAAWIYVRTGTTWTQQAKLVGTGNIGLGMNGYGAALSADGNTAAVGGPGDDNTLGATWIFTRSGATWTQEAKVTGTGIVGGMGYLGYSVSLSADGNTLLSAGVADDGVIGAAWIHTRSGTSWTQQGSKYVGAGSAAGTYFGFATSISADGGVWMCGGVYDNANIGSVWSFGK